MAVPKIAPRSRELDSLVSLEVAEPLFKRAPREDELGRPLSDFMMIIPQLRTRSQRLLEYKVDRIQRVLEHFNKVVVFADLNLRINVLWVIVRQVPGVCLDIPAAIIREVPEALLVAHPRLA